MNNFKECTETFERDEGGERHIRHVSPLCWISTIYRRTGFGYYEWETAICFRHPPEGRKETWKDREVLIIRGDRREELNDVPEDQLRQWYQDHIDGNRNSMETMIEALKPGKE